MRVRPKSLSSSRRFLCPVVVHVRLKSLSSSGLSSTELEPSAIPNERATPQSGAPNSNQCSKCTTADVIGLAYARSCTMHLQTDIYNIYIYKYRGISNRTRLLASLRSLRSRRSAITQSSMLYHDIILYSQACCLNSLNHVPV